MLVDLARLPVYVVTSGPVMLANLGTLVAILVGVVVGTLFGAPILRRLPERTFRRLLAVALIALGIALVAGLGS
jgi:uncharacterized membrane protein YfcA